MIFTKLKRLINYPYLPIYYIRHLCGFDAKCNESIKTSRFLS